jgi:chromosome segregation ATPase
MYIYYFSILFVPCLTNLDSTHRRLDRVVSLETGRRPNDNGAPRCCCSTALDTPNCPFGRYGSVPFRQVASTVSVNGTHGSKGSFGGDWCICRQIHLRAVTLPALSSSSSMVARSPAVLPLQPLAPRPPPQPSRSRSVSKLPSARTDVEWQVNMAQSTSLDRRARSSMRLPSSRIPPPHTQPRQSQQHSRSQPWPALSRPRPVSTARLLGNESSPLPSQTAAPVPPSHSPDEDDPEAVERHVLDLRQKREQQARRHYTDPSRSRSSKAKDRPSPSSAPSSTLQRTYSNGSSQAENRQPPTRDSPGQRAQSSPVILSPRLQEEERATQTLRLAEQNIDGLLQELEELRFFQELDNAAPSPPQKVLLGAMKHSPRTTASPAPPPTVRGNLGVPAGRVPSPHRGSRNSSPLDLSPRTIGKMDRTSLELETQTLIRNVQILAQEKRALESAVEMYELTLQDHAAGQHNNDTCPRVIQLENDLRSVSDRLREAKEDLAQVRTQVASDYESRMTEVNEELRKVRAQADTYQRERDHARQQAEARKAEYASRKASFKQELKGERNSYQAREAMLELQFEEMTEILESLRTETDEKTHELETLRDELAEAGKALADNKKKRDHSYEVRISSLEEQLKLAQDKHQAAVARQDEMTSIVAERDRALAKARAQNEEQTTLVADMTARLDSVHGEYRKKFTELKEAYEAKSTRRLSEIVESQSDENKEYERRLQALQEQLEMATDRHHAEMRQKDDALEAALKRERNTMRAEIKEQADKVISLQTELLEIRQQHEIIDVDRRRLRREMESANPALRELEIQDQVRGKELERLAEVSERLERQIAEKDRRIQDLSSRLSESEQQQHERILEMQRQHQQELLSREADLEGQKESSAAMESRLREDLQKVHSELYEIKSASGSRTKELERELEQANSSLASAKKSSQNNESLKERIEDIQSAYEKAQSDMMFEQTRHETAESEMKVQIAKLEGKIRAGESSLIQKRNLIEELEERLQDTSKKSTSSTKELQKELNNLHQELRKANEALLDEQNKSERKAEKLACLSDELATLKTAVVEAQKDVAEKVRLLAKAQAQLNHASSEEKKNKVAISSVQERLDKERSNLVAKVERIAELNNELDMVRSTLGCKDERIAALEEYIQNIEAGSNESNLRMEGLNCQVKSLQQELTLQKARVEELEDALRCEKEERETVASALYQAEEQHRSLLEETNRVHQVESEMSQLQSSLSESEKIIKKLSTALARKEDEIEDMKSEEKLLRTEAEKVIDLERTTTKLRKSLEQSQSATESLSLEIESAEEKMSQLNSEKRHLLEKADHVTALQENITELQQALSKAESEMICQGVHLTKLKQDHSEALLRLKEFEARSEQTVADLKVKGHEASQYAALHTELQDRLTEERKSKEELKNRLCDMEADIEIKEHQLTRLPKLQLQLKDMIRGREELQTRLGQLEADLDRKERQISKITERHSQQLEEVQSDRNEQRNAKDALQAQFRAVVAELEMKSDRLDHISKLHCKLQEQTETNESLRSKLDRAEAELVRRRKQIEGLSDDFSVDLHTKVEELTHAKAVLEATLRGMEEDRDEREKQVKESSERYSNQIVDLQMTVEDLTRLKASLTRKIAIVEAELERKDDQVSMASTQVSGDLTSLQAEYVDQLAVSERLEEKVEALEARLVESDNAESSISKRLSEVQLQLEMEAKEKRSLKMKIGDVEEELERKEKQVKDVVERYSREIRRLENDLADQANVKRGLERPIAKRLDETTDYSTGEDRSLLQEFEMQRKELRDQLFKSEQSKRDVEQKLKKANSERSEVISALEEVINEVQSREEEIEQLAHVLRKRDEELEHAKLIATKALASAQEMKARFEDRGSDSGQASKLDELTSSLKYLSSKNDNLQRRTTLLEKELEDREVECSTLRTELTLLQKSRRSKKEIQDQSLSRHIGSEIDGASFAKFDDSPIISGDTADTVSMKSTDTKSAELGSRSSWIHDFDEASTDSGQLDHSSMSEIQTEASQSDSRRSIERDALRKYVRKRYLRSKAATS